jgi:hypothetical protein
MFNLASTSIKNLRFESIEVQCKNFKLLNLKLSTFWSGKRDSNSRPRPWQGRALPTELFPLDFNERLFGATKVANYLNFQINLSGNPGFFLM